MYRLPDTLRRELAKPLAPVLNTQEALEQVEGRELIAVGDVVSKTFLEHGHPPRLMVIDGKTQRHDDLSAFREERERDPDAVVLPVENPPATITDELDTAIRTALQAAGRHVILVTGEEDLATLPALLHAPDGSLVAYGQPGEGVVLIQVNAETRQRARQLLDQMEVKA